MKTTIVCSAPISAVKAESLVLTALVALSLLSTPSVAQQTNSAADVQPPPMVVHLPEQQRSFPEALPTGKTAPGFKIRGIKGWMWKPQQYLVEIPVLARYEMNFMMNGTIQSRHKTSSTELFCYAALIAADHTQH